VHFSTEISYFFAPGSGSGIRDPDSQYGSGSTKSLNPDPQPCVKVHALQNGGGGGQGDYAANNGGEYPASSLYHPPPKEHKCECCGKVFVRIDLLKEHMTVHTGARPYLCNGCGLYFSKKSNLARHSLLHLDHKPCR
jgi:uncharacterized Zn-finger protein